MTFGQFFTIASGGSAICFFLAALLLIGFRTGRLRIFNIVVVFVLAFFAGVYYLEFGARIFNMPLKATAWGLLAVCAGYGLFGMVRLARTERPVWDRRKKH